MIEFTIYITAMLTTNAVLFFVSRRLNERRVVAAYVAGYRRGRKKGQEIIIRSVRKVIADWQPSDKS